MLTSVPGCCVSVAPLSESKYTLQPCEVCLELRGQDSTFTHKLRTTLAPDGSRVHKLNDKTRTAKELKVRQAIRLLESSISKRGLTLRLCAQGSMTACCMGCAACIKHS